jgi:hypothetical protein
MEIVKALFHFMIDLKDAALDMLKSAVSWLTSTRYVLWVLGGVAGVALSIGLGFALWNLFQKVGPLSPQPSALTGTWQLELTYIGGPFSTPNTLYLTQQGKRLSGCALGVTGQRIIRGKADLDTGEVLIKIENYGTITAGIVTLTLDGTFDQGYSQMWGALEMKVRLILQTLEIPGIWKAVRQSTQFQACEEQ